MYDYHLTIFWHFNNLYLWNSFPITTSSMSFEKTLNFDVQKKTHLTSVTLFPAGSSKCFGLCALCLKVLLVPILGSVLGLLTGRKTYAWIIGGRGDLDVSPLTVRPSPHSEGQFSEKRRD